MFFIGVPTSAIFGKYILCMESVFSSMMYRGWIWTWFWLKGKSFTWCLTRCYNTLYIFGKYGSAWLIRFDLRELELIGLISSLLSNLSLYGMVIFGIYWRFRLIFFWEFSAWVFLRVLLTDGFDTPCLGVRNTRSGVRGRKVSRRLFDQASDVHLYSSCRSLLIFSLYEEIFSEVMTIISHI